MVKKKTTKVGGTTAKSSSTKSTNDGFKNDTSSKRFSTGRERILRDERDDIDSYVSSDVEYKNTLKNRRKNRNVATRTKSESKRRQGKNSGREAVDDRYSFDNDSVSSGSYLDDYESANESFSENERDRPPSKKNPSKRKGSASVAHSNGGKNISKSSERNLRSKHTQACKYLQKAQFDKALQCFESILEILIEKYGEQHYRVGAAMHNIGIVHLRAGDLADALEALELAVAVRKAALGKHHPKVADSLVEMGIVFLSLKRYDDSLDVLNEALDLREREVSTSPDPKKQLLVAKILNNIGCVYYEYGDMRAARKTLNEALKIQEEILGSDDPNSEPGLLSMASTMCNVGYVYLERKKYDDAIVMFEEALTIQEEVLGSDNPLVIHTMDNLAYAFSHDGNLDGAMKIYTDILDSQREMLGSDSIDVADTLKKMSYIHIKLYQFEEALSFISKILKIQEKYYDKNDRELRDTRKLLNGVNYHLLKFHNPTESLIMGLTRQGIQNPFTNRTLDFSFFGTVGEELDARAYAILKPTNTSKVSGHKITYA